METTLLVDIYPAEMPEPFFWFVADSPQPDRVPDDLKHRLPGVQMVLREWTTYRVVIPDAVALWIGNIRIEPVFDVGQFQFSIQNKLGITAIRPDYAGGFGGAVHAEVIAAKFATVGESVRFAQAMVDQLSARISQLPFVITAETARQVLRAHGKPNLFFTFHYLRHHGGTLIRALDVIGADPHRKLGDVVEHLRIHEARRIDAEALHSLLTGPRAETPSTNPDASVLERLQPLRIRQRRPEETYDTPENRFVVAACRRLRTLIDQIRQQYWWLDATDADVLLVQNVERAVRRLLQSDRFRVLEASLVLPAYSRVLQMKPGYRELTTFWSGLTQIHVPVLNRLAKAIDLRDMPTIYEFWQFFELADAIGRYLEMKPVIELPDDAYPANWDLRAVFAGHGTLTTQHTFGGKATYTPINLRPDFVWRAEDGGMVALDAKFAMQGIGDFQRSEEDTAGYRATSRDITKMHAYRDAIAGVNAAIALFPGTIGRFWPASGDARGVDSIDDLVPAIVACDLDGIGAVPMMPTVGGEM